MLNRALGLPQRELEAAAVERWEIAPSVKRFIPSARFLPRQLDRIQGTEFGSIEEVLRDLRGGFETIQPETLGFRLKHVDLVDGVLYAGQGVKHLRPRSRRALAYRAPAEVTRGALYESWVGNRWFGNWLAEDCLTYALAARHGDPVTTTLAPSGHVPRYEALLGMTPRRVARAHFEELILFRDPENADRKRRANQLRERLVGPGPFDRHPGVFLLRGSTGMKRILTNEQAIAEHLAAERGFRILDPSRLSVEEIIAACAGARVVAGVEGSHLFHGLMTMPQDAALFVIQPPYRAVTLMKRIVDRQGQPFLFVVAEGGQDEFSVKQEDVARTLDLID
jgi:hypothetical protein